MAFGRISLKVNSANVGNSDTTHTDTRFAPNGTTTDEPRKLRKKEGQRVIDG